MSSSSLPLRAFMALTRPERDRRTELGAGRRGTAPLVWMHLSGEDQVRAAVALSRRLLREAEGVQFLFTTDEPDRQLWRLIAGDPAITLAAAPPEDRAAVAEFLKEWSPDVMIWAAGLMRPLLIGGADSQDVPRLLVNAREAEIMSSRGTWVPGLTRSLLRRFDRALAVDAEAAGRLTRFGVDPERVEVTGTFLEDTLPLPCDEEERSYMAERLTARPVWLAAEVREQEVDLIFEAHRKASRRTHRLLLILTPEVPGQGPAIRDSLAEQGVETALRSADEDPLENTEIYVADVPGEMGLWYRLAPITLMGGTLIGGQGRDPFEAAALGSAVLHGPETVPYGTRYFRLARDGGSRMVHDAGELGQAVETLIAPDRAAALAHAGWGVVSAGAEVTNRMIELIFELLDRHPA